MWKFSVSRLGFKKIQELLDLTFYEYFLMREAIEESMKQDLEFQFYMQKRAIGEAMSGKSKPLFDNKDNAMTRDDNHNKFKEFSERFNKRKLR